MGDLCFVAEEGLRVMLDRVSSTKRPPKSVLSLFGTRPEIIKLAPVLDALAARPKRFRSVQVASGQHADLLAPFLHLFRVRVDHQLAVMHSGQSLNSLASRLLASLDPILELERPDVVLVQGDTTTALAGAFAAFQRNIPVAHVEAGLRSGDLTNPFPEEMNRRLITRLARWHFAATADNRRNLLRDGVERSNVFVTGNPVVDSLHLMLKENLPTPAVDMLLKQSAGLRRIVLTTHRRESFGEVLDANLQTLREFVERRPETALLFPVHPNPKVQDAVRRTLHGAPRVWLTPPLDYPSFLRLLGEAWLIVSDSGGVQEEACTLHKRLFVLRRTTERPEGVVAGVAKLVGEPKNLTAALEEAFIGETDLPQLNRNPFGRGDSGPRIARLLSRLLQTSKLVPTLNGRPG